MTASTISTDRFATGRRFFVDDALEHSLSKLRRKDKRRYFIVWKKIREVVSSHDIGHYKNLKKPLQHLKRVHVDKHFVLTFQHDRTTDTVTFIDLDHHDKIYKKRTDTS